MACAGLPQLHTGGTFPARGTWIEIGPYWRRAAEPQDVPRKGNVDRNEQVRDYTLKTKDVPRKGNVDRNVCPERHITTSLGDVPRKGNVDRNI